MGTRDRSEQKVESVWAESERLSGRGRRSRGHLSIVVIIVILIFVKLGLGPGLGFLHEVVRNELELPVGVSTQPAHLEDEWLVFGLVVHSENHLGDVAQCLLARERGEVKLFNVALRALATLAKCAAVVSQAVTRRLERVQLVRLLTFVIARDDGRASKGP